MIRLHKVGGEDTKERVAICSGDLIQWNETTKCVFVIKPDGAKLRWEGSLLEGRVVGYITSSAIFNDFIHIAISLMALDIEYVESDRHHTTYQVK